MIEANELTIGSLVTDEHYDTFKTIIKVESINDKGINLCIEDDGNWAEIAQTWIAPEYYTFDKLFGIPLTEDILIRCGFEKKNEYDNLYVLNTNDCSLTLGYKYPEIQLTSDFELKNIHFLHQFQNLVKLLCNQTIELK